jgi:thymidylate kinase
MFILSRKLITTLNDENINYCHWKSNLLLGEALAGYDDLDLLVKTSDIYLFESVVNQLGFKRATNRSLEIQSVHHFYGFDKNSGEILHLHVYYQIKTGPSWTKSIRFDFEDYVLDNLISHHSGMPIPVKHIEIVMFCIRIMMKYTKFNEIVLVGKESQRTIDEIDYLLDGLDNDKLEQFLTEFFPRITVKDFFEYISVLRDGNIYLKLFYARKVKTNIKKYLYQGFFENLVNNTKQGIYRVSNKLFLKQKKKLFSGGNIIVVAGLDATGKTTITGDLKRWLGKNFTTDLVHFGKPTSSIFTFVINFVIKISRKKTSINSKNRSSLRTENKQKSLIFIIRQLVLAFDRYFLVRNIWKKSAKGRIILCDRYKSEDFGVMDSKRLFHDDHRGLKKTLSLRESKLYNSMPSPDLLFYLTVPVEIAVQRNEDRIKNGKESEEFLRKRHAENQNLNYKSKNIFIIDTNREYQEVISEIKALVWQNI